MMNAQGLTLEETPSRWVRTFLLTLMAGLALLASLNGVVDPYGYLGSGLFPPLTWSSREAKVRLLEAAPSPEVLVLGSSRTMKVSPTYITALTGKPAFNACVDSARVEDWYAIYMYARDDVRARVSELVIGVDLEAFHDHVEPDGRLLASSDLRAQLPWSMRVKRAEQLVGLFGYVTTTDSLRSLALSRQGYPPPPTRFDPDGLAHDTVEKHFDPEKDVQFEAYEGRFERFTAIDPERARLFEALLARATSERVRVRAFVSPLHPRLVARLERTREFARLRALVVGYLEQLRGRFPGFSVVDFTDLEAFGGDPAMFTDAAHTNDENSRRMTRALFVGHALQ